MNPLTQKKQLREEIHKIILDNWEDNYEVVVDQLLQLFKEEAKGWFNAGNGYIELHEEELDEIFNDLWKNYAKSRRIF